MKDSIIISFASKGREDYNKGLLRLMDSVKEHWDGDYAFYSFDGNTNLHNGMDIHCCNGIMPQPKAFECKTHQEVPYQFKFGLIQIAREQGYKKVFWLDSSLVLHKNPLPLLEQGIMAFHNLGHPLWKYISDQAVDNLSCWNYLYEIQQTWGGAIGFDFGTERICHIFDRIVRQSLVGSFNEGGSQREGVIAHRHDQAVMSVLFHQHSINLHPYGKIVTHPHYMPPYEYGEDFYIIHKPIT